MAEQVIRHRGRTWDENSQLTADVPDKPLLAFAVAPRGGSEAAESGRDRESTAFTVYFRDPDIDIKNSDQLTVRGERFGIVVNVWRSPWSQFGGLEVLCSRSQG